MVGILKLTDSFEIDTKNKSLLIGDSLTQSPLELDSFVSVLYLEQLKLKEEVDSIVVQTILSLKKRIIEIHYSLGYAYVNISKVDSAIYHAKEAIRLANKYQLRSTFLVLLIKSLAELKQLKIGDVVYHLEL